METRAAEIRDAAAVANARRQPLGRTDVAWIGDVLALLAACGTPIRTDELLELARAGMVALSRCDCPQWAERNAIEISRTEWLGSEYHYVRL